MKDKDEMLNEGQVYEIGFHILPTVPEENIQGIVSKLKDFITKNGGEVLAEDYPKMRVLAYEIRKRIETKYLNFNKAHFGWVKFEMLPTSIVQIKEEAKNNPDILRFIIVKTVKENTLHTPKPPMMKTNAPDETRVAKEAVPAEKIEVSEEEIDKSIDELLANENEKLAL